MEKKIDMFLYKTRRNVSYDIQKIILRYIMVIYPCMHEHSRQ